MRDPLLVSATDGVGTKTAIASALERFETIGIDLVAMCADDVVCSGAAPLYFLDYVAVGRLDPSDVADLVGGIAAGCREAGCALVGGETAEHPGIMEEDEFDLAGFCVGVVERDRAIDGSTIQVGRRDRRAGRVRPPRERVLARPGARSPSTTSTCARPTRSGFAARSATPPPTPSSAPSRGSPSRPSARSCSRRPGSTPARSSALRTALEAAGHDLRGIAHVTGGGLPGNVPRTLPAGLAARLDPGRWPMPSVMRLFGALGGLEDDELRATFNGGLGMVVVVTPEAVEATIAKLAVRGHPGLAGRRRRPGRVGRWPALRGGADPVTRAERRIAVGVSGGGSNLQALTAAADRGELGGSIALVFADRPCAALEWAAGRRIDTALVLAAAPDDPAARAAEDAELAAALADASIDLVVLAGYMRIVGPAVLGAFPGRILNTHPSLLPAFPGAHAVRDALAHGVAVSGATVHLVDATLDGGPIVAQEAVPVLPDDDEASLHARIRAVEHRLLPRAVALALSGALGVEPGARRVVVDVDQAEAALPVPRRALLSVSDKTRPGRLRPRARRPRVRARVDRRDRPGAARRRACRSPTSRP